MQKYFVSFLKTLLCLVLLLGLAPAQSRVEDEIIAPQVRKNRVLVGAIRWDAWYGSRGRVGLAVERSLGPEKWHARIPFYGRALSDTRASIDGSSQEVMDKEIAFAADAGIDYWAFVSYGSQDPSSLALKHYLASKSRGRLRFALIFEYSRWGSSKNYKVILSSYAKQTALRGYLQVLNGRPLVFLQLGDERKATAWGGFAAMRKSVEYFRAACRRYRAGNPYIVVQQWDPEQLASIRESLGADAISAYSVKDDHAQAAPYASLAAYAEDFWRRCRQTGSSVVPIVMAGWDRRPRVEHPVPWETWQQPNVGLSYFYESPSAGQLAEHLDHALTWVRENQDVDPANAVLIYAWNENDEGGWLVPTLSEGAARLDALRAVLGR